MLKAQEILGAVTGPVKVIAPTAAVLKPIDEITRTAILSKMFMYFKNAVRNSPPARDYMTVRGLDFMRLEIGFNSGQFHHGSRKDEMLINSCVQVGLLIPHGSNTRTGGQAYKPFGKECICFAL